MENQQSTGRDWRDWLGLRAWQAWLALLAWLADDTRFKQLVSVLIALITLTAATVAYLQNDAASLDDEANRQAQTAALQEMGLAIRNDVALNYHVYGVTNHWLFAGMEAAQAADPAPSLAAQAAVEELSALYAPPYFDPDADETPDVMSYVADQQMEDITVLREQFTDRYAVKQEWDGKANTYILHLTILAVALFLFGLALAIDNSIRLLFLATGVLIALVTIVWVVDVYRRPVVSIPDEAIRAFARGSALSFQHRHAEALAALDDAITAAPTYGSAYYARAESHFYLDDYAAAIADAEAAQRNGRDDAGVAWDLGWLQYLSGDFAAAIAAYEHGLALSPDMIGVRLDYGLALLADGQVAEAQSVYAQSIQDAAEQLAEARSNESQPPASLWLHLDEGAQGLDDLIALLDGEPNEWGETPPLESLPLESTLSADAMGTAATALLASVKSASVGLEFAGVVPAASSTLSVSPLAFAHALTGDDGHDMDEVEAGEVFPYGTDTVIFSFDYAGAKDGVSEIWKFSLDDEENPAWRINTTWTRGAEGSDSQQLSFDFSDFITLEPGVYRVDLYVDYQLAQTGQFWIVAQE